MRQARGGGLAALAVAALALGAGGCGGGSGPAPASLASDVPAKVPLYVEATVTPEGETKAALSSSISKLLGTQDPGARFVAGVDRRLQQVGLSYEKDIAPWLGQEAAVFYLSVGSSSKGAIVAQASDAGAAEDAFRKGAEASGTKVTSATHTGVDMAVAGDDAFAVVDGNAVLGSRAAVEAAIDASRGRSLADSKDYTSSLAGAPSDRVFTAWADPSRLIDSLVKSGSITAASAARVRSQLGAVFSSPLAAWGEATKDSLAVELSFAGSAGASAPSHSLITGFPDDSWFAFGFSRYGKSVSKALRQLRSTSAAELGSPNALLERVRAALGVDVGNIGKWLGNVSGYISGTSPLSFGGAIVLQTRDEAASAKSLAQLQKLFEKDVDVVTRPLGGSHTGFTVTPRGLPVEFVFEQRAGKVMAGLGQGSVDQALNPSSPLGDSSAFRSATASLDGLTPTLYLDFKPISTLLDIPGVSTNPNLELVKPYLDRLDYVVAGGGAKDGRRLVRIALGVRSGGASSGNVASAGAPAYASLTP